MTQVTQIVLVIQPTINPVTYARDVEIANQLALLVLGNKSLFAICNTYSNHKSDNVGVTYGCPLV